MQQASLEKKGACLYQKNKAPDLLVVHFLLDFPREYQLGMKLGLERNKPQEMSQL